MNGDNNNMIELDMSPNKKLMDTKNKLQNAKQTLMEDINDTKARMKERMDEVIEVSVYPRVEKVNLE